MKRTHAQEVVDWVSKKFPTYCQQHGERVIGFFNGIGMCERCTSEISDFVDAPRTDAKGETR